MRIIINIGMMLLWHVQFCCYTQRRVFTVAVFAVYGRTYTVRFSRMKKKKRKKRTHCGRKSKEKEENIFTDVRIHSRQRQRFCFVARKRARSRHSFVGTSIALSHAQQQMHLIKHIFFLCTREKLCTPPEINARRTIVVKGPLCCAFPLLAGNIIKD